MVEVKIGVRDVPRELVLESDEAPDAITAAVEEAVVKNTLLRLVDERGRVVIVPGSQIGYLEMGAPKPTKVGFGSA
jgi:hypothetical protein